MKTIRLPVLAAVRPLGGEARRARVRDRVPRWDRPARSR